MYSIYIYIYSIYIYTILYNINLLHPHVEEDSIPPLWRFRTRRVAEASILSEEAAPKAGKTRQQWAVVPTDQQDLKSVQKETTKQTAIKVGWGMRDGG